jgi:multiple sugar transport system permease protein
MTERNVGAAVAPGQLTRTHVKPVGKGKGAVDRLLLVVAYVVLIAVTLVMFVPFAFTVVTSLKTNQETNNLTFASLLWPENPTLEAYRTVFDADVGRWFFNSAFVAAMWVFGRCVFDTMAGYAFARMQFPGRQLVFLAILSTLMVPGIVLIIPRFIILDRLNLLNSYGALTIPFVSSAFGIFLMKQFFESIPAELEEAARVDGANRFRMFAQIILPNTMPALITLTIFTFQASWNAFLEPLIYISNSDFYTLPLGLAFFRYEFKTDWPTQMAIAVITTVPIAIFFIIFQRYFVESNTSSGIKG